MKTENKKNSQPKPAAKKADQTQMQASSRMKTPQAGEEDQQFSSPQMGVAFTDWASI